MRETTYYECDFCKTHSKHKAFIKGHEKKCYRNPALKACASCKWWFKHHEKFGNPPSEEDFYQDGVGNIHCKPIPFCSNPDHDYSAVRENIDGYGELITGTVVNRDCDGWSPCGAA